jgi:hypothetical protein
MPLPGPVSARNQNGRGRACPGSIVRQLLHLGAEPIGHHDIADTTISERAGTAERVGEMLGAGRSRQGFHGHG